MTEIESDFIQINHVSEFQLRDELSNGLRAASAFVSPKYFYDTLGSKLFAAICELPEYYPTRTEASIFRRYLSEIAASVGAGCTLIDLGAGDCTKAAALFSVLQPAQYVPVDISVNYLKHAVSQLQRQYPHIKMTGLGMDFSTAIALPDVVQSKKRLFFYPGSSIGNFTPDEALAFFRRLHNTCDSEGGLLIGVDLIKDEEILNAAYDDSLGVTAAFNLNVLTHLNRLLRANFDIKAWRHVGFYNASLNRIEMYLEARNDQTVKWGSDERHFQAGERIHTENSYKYQPEQFVTLLQQAGMQVTGRWCDAQNWFMVCHARVA